MTGIGEQPIILENHNIGWLALVIAAFLFYRALDSKTNNSPSIFVLLFGEAQAPNAFRASLLLLAVFFLCYFVYLQSGFMRIVLLMTVTGAITLGYGAWTIYSAIFPNSPYSMMLSDEVEFLWFRFRSKGITRWGVFLHGVAWSFAGGVCFFGAIAGYIELYSLGLLEHIE